MLLRKQLGFSDFRILLFLLLLVVTVATGAEAARVGAIPVASQQTVQALEQLDHEALPTLDMSALAREDALRAAAGLPDRFAQAHQVSITPADRGSWEWLDADRLLWRLRITAPGALSLNLGFSRFELPWGAQLQVYPAGAEEGGIAFGADDNTEHGQLWTPVVLTDDLIIELLLPADRRDDYELELSAINHGYRFFGESVGDKSGDCNIDVICPEGDPWRDEIRSVAVYSFGGNKICTGFMINNIRQDETPYFLTAAHCIDEASEAPSIVVYWNYESPACGQQGGGSLDEFQTSSTLRATSTENTSSDFTLLELDDLPDPVWEVSYAGWNRSDADPDSAVTIHHPSTDEKSISFENDPCLTTSYGGDESPGDGTHIKVPDWDLGTTEGGSSGSPLFDQDHFVVGQLHGGGAACYNNLPDWYGRFSVSWQGGGTPETRLSDWLDPDLTGAMTLDLMDPNASGLRVTPFEDFVAQGDPGGPFTPSSQIYTLENNNDTPLDYEVSADVSWLVISDSSGSLAAGETREVTVAIAAAADSLDLAYYEGTVRFTNLSDGEGDTSRDAVLRVGDAPVVYSYSFDDDPHWQSTGAWAFGIPQGQGGSENGAPDPTSGYTGANVYGYNLAGDYENQMNPEYLTTTPLYCAGLQGVTLQFWRWLGVERAQYDHATVSVSNDGITYVDVWVNPSGEDLTGGEWVQQSVDISAVADGQSTVYLRWTMGPTDPSEVYCGWNIDDVEIRGYGRLESLPTVQAFPNPFSAADGTQIAFFLREAGRVQVYIYDVRGYLVTTLTDGGFAAGGHSVPWYGTDSDDHGVAGGVYLYRVVIEGRDSTGKLTFLR